MASSLTLFVTGLTTGLLAGGASCAAVQGGLLASAVTRRHKALSDENHQHVGPFAPVAAFLGAKLVSHTLLGAALGIVGAAIQPGPRTQAILLLAAGVLMVLFALDMMGVSAVRRFIPQLPASWGTRVRRSAKSSSAGAPAVLGFLTVLIPCGVTLSMELVAVTTGSVLGGAAVMAGFVIGTGPLFAVIGVVLRSAARLWQGRLSVATGVVVLAVAVWTLTSGVRLGGWWPDGTAPAAAETVVPATTVRTVDGRQIVTIQARSDGYTPEMVVAKADTPTTLVVATNRTGGCVRSFVIPALDKQLILEATGETSVDLGTPKSGTLKYSCGMGMYSGRVVFKGAGS
ncbi:sulfite exporter TauE/SafE family protein [Kribbella sp. NPDC056951]|uniref:sulfite exporter TauE/SafE family protein n=1 Tax=Kribbella sp. NPDC056951 TaxID=3345978 RepID=UPI003635EC2C